MNALKRAILHALAVSGVGAMTRSATRRHPRVLMYHGFGEEADPRRGAISRDAFRRHLLYIKKHFTPWKLSDLVKHYKTHGAYPKGAVVITVDDGYENFYSIALPLLKEFGIPATVFIVAEAADENRWLWTDVLDYAFENTPALKTRSRPPLHKEILANLKTLCAERRETALNNLLAEYAVSVPASPPPEFRLMSWSQLRAALDTGLVEVGGHSCTHPILAHLDAQESRHEIVGAKQMLEKRLGVGVTSFCYPNGQPGDYTTEQQAIAEAAGYTCCTASHDGFVGPNSDQYALPRIAGEPDFNRFRFVLDGIYHVLIPCMAALNRSKRKMPHEKHC